MTLIRIALAALACLLLIPTLALVALCAYLNVPTSERA